MNRGLVRLTRGLAPVWLCALVAGCEPDGGLHGSPPPNDLPSRPAPSGDADMALRTADTLPVAGSEPVVLPLGLGRDPTPRELDSLDVDVRPDGTGLPPGSGTVEEGAAIYAARCTACHGPEGLGTPAGWPLVGRNPGDAFDFHESIEKERRRTIGNYWPHATTLFDYTRRTMPYDAPGSLSDDEVYALTAWMLWRNRVIGYEEVMDATTLPGVVMPAYNRFIPDDRAVPDRGGPPPR